MSTGLMDSTVMLSFEHLVLVDELASQYKQMHMNTDEAHIAIQEIKDQIPPDYNYLVTDHTLEFMKEAVHYSDFSGRAGDPDKDWYDIAHDKVKKILAPGHENVEGTKIVAKRLAAAEARLKEDDITWREGKDGWWDFYLQDI